MTDVDEYILTELTEANISRTKKIMGVFIDELYCYLTKKLANTKASVYFIEKIIEEESMDKIIISESIDDEIQTLLVNYLTKRGIKFIFTDEEDEDTEAYMVFIAKRDIQREELEYKSDIPDEYLNHVGIVLCKNCYKKLEEIDPDFASLFKKPPLFGLKECDICRKEEPKEDFYL